LYLAHTHTHPPTHPHTHTHTHTHTHHPPHKHGAEYVYVGIDLAFQIYQ
jgi:hypothetical protein